MEDRKPFVVVVAYMSEISKDKGNDDRLLFLLHLVYSRLGAFALFELLHLLVIMSPRKKNTVNKFYLIKSAVYFTSGLQKATQKYSQQIWDIKNNPCLFLLNNLIWIVSALVSRHNFSPLKVQNQI